MTTTFDKTNSIMTHVFRNGFELVVDFKKCKIFTLKDKKPLETVDFSTEYSLLDYNKLLETVGNIANY